MTSKMDVDYDEEVDDVEGSKRPAVPWITSTEYPYQQQPPICTGCGYDIRPPEAYQNCRICGKPFCKYCKPRHKHDSGLETGAWHAETPFTNPEASKWILPRLTTAERDAVETGTAEWPRTSRVIGDKAMTEAASVGNPFPGVCKEDCVGWDGCNGMCVSAMDHKQEHTCSECGLKWDTCAMTSWWEGKAADTITIQFTDHYRRIKGKGKGKSKHSEKEYGRKGKATQKGSRKGSMQRMPRDQF